MLNLQIVLSYKTFLFGRKFSRFKILSPYLSSIGQCEAGVIICEPPRHVCAGKDGLGLGETDLAVGEGADLLAGG